MDIFKRLLGLSSPDPTPISPLRLLTLGNYDVEVVGESKYQVALERICGGRSETGADHQCTALLVPEPENLYDTNAIKVIVDSDCVGYIARPMAAQMRAHFGLQACAVPARIAGGWDDGVSRGHFGIRLDFVWPPVVT